METLGAGCHNPESYGAEEMKLVALWTDIRREQGRQRGGHSVSSGNCYGAEILYVDDRVSCWTARATHRGVETGSPLVGGPFGFPRCLSAVALAKAEAEPKIVDR